MEAEKNLIFLHSGSRLILHFFFFFWLVEAEKIIFFLFGGSKLIPHFCLVEAEQINPTFLVCCKQNISLFCMVEAEYLHILFCWKQKKKLVHGYREEVKVPRYCGKIQYCLLKLCFRRVTLSKVKKTLASWDHNSIFWGRKYTSRGGNYVRTVQRR